MGEGGGEVEDAINWEVHIDIKPQEMWIGLLWTQTLFSTL